MLFRSVPISDTEMCSFIVATEKGGGGGLKARAEVKPDANELTAEILAGRMNIKQVLEHPYLATIQDQVAQAGQGANVDRSLERLGLSDRHLGFFRRIWTREVHAMLEGRPIKRGDARVDCSPLHEQKHALIAAGMY